MDIRQLRYFVTVYEEMSFTKAARRLYVSQPTLSKAIKSMEIELDEPLFDRESSELRLTDVGEALLLRARSILREFDGITSAALDLKNLETGRVVIGIPPLISTLYFSTIIADFKQRHPGIILSVREVDVPGVISQIRDETMDLGVSIQPIQGDDLSIKHLCREEIVAVMRRDNPLSHRENLSFSDLRHQPLNLLSEGFNLYRHTLKRCREAGVEPVINVTSSQWEFLLQNAMAGNGIAILPLPILPNLGPEMCWRSFNPKYPWDIVLLWKRDQSLSYASRAFISRAEHYFSNPSISGHIDLSHLSL